MTFPLVPLGLVLSSPITDGPHSTPEFLSAGVPFLSVDGIQDGELDFSKSRYISEEDHAEFSKKSKPQKGDVLIGKAASTGKIALVRTDFEFNIWSPLAIIRSGGAVNSSYLAYALKAIPSQIQIDNLCSYNTQKNIAMSDIPRIRIPLPPLETQQRIADYLDRETAEIDAAVADLDRYVELLRARKVLILTKSFPNPFDSPIERDSKFDGWEKRPLWSMFVRQKILGFVDEPMVSVFRDRGVVYKESHENLNQTAEDRSIYQLVEPGWLAVNRMKAWQGSVGISEIRGITSGHYICFRPAHSENHQFMNYLLRSPGYKTWYLNYSRGVRPGQAEIDNGWLTNLPIFVPPINIQNEIVEYLDRETTEIDTLIAESSKLRELLLKRRSVLITEVVTGRKQV